METVERGDALDDASHELPTAEPGRRPPWLTISKVIVWLVTSAILWQSAWLSDDALLTIRSAVNWHAGYGPVFNIDEAVACYTHPLWFFLISAQGAMTGSWIYGTVYLNLALAVAVAAILVVRSRNWWQLAMTVVVVLFSTAFTDWMGSGLEGALAALLLCVLAFATLDAPRAWAGWLVGALLLCRLDLVLLLAPVVMWLAYTYRHEWRRLAQLAAGVLLPVAAWAIWAWSVYGSVLPSTFAAKTNSVIGRGELLSRGREYVAASIHYDPVIVAVIVLAVLVFIIGSIQVRAMLAGTGVYLLYVVWIGGDYLLGRFFLLPIVVVLLCMTATALPLWRTANKAILWAVPALAALLAVPGSRVFDPGLKAPGRTDKLYFQDDRLWSLFGRSLDPLGLVDVSPSFVPTDLPLLDQKARAWPRDARFTGQTMVSCHGLGAVSFLAEPSIHLIDPCGLTDRFVASLPFAPAGFWKAGHFERPLPEGYELAVKTQDPDMVKDPVLREKLRDLWTRIRQQ